MEHVFEYHGRVLAKLRSEDGVTFFDYVAQNLDEQDLSYLVDQMTATLNFGNSSESLDSIDLVEEEYAHA